MANEKRLIDANALIKEIVFVKNCLATDDKAGEWAKGYRSGLGAAIEEIEELPTVDAVEVVRCKDCKYFTEGMAVGMCKRIPDKPIIPIVYDHFCSYGERREGE